VSGDNYILLAPNSAFDAIQHLTIGVNSTWKKALWLIPESRAKMRREIRVPLPSQAVGILRELHTITGYAELVFPGHGRGGGEGRRIGQRPISENTLNGALRRMGYGADQMTAHGFRAAASTLLNDSGRFRPDVIEAALGHQEANAVTDVDSFWSGSEFMIFNGRLYLDIGNRNRLRVDMTKGSRWLGKPASAYARVRETGFLELGLGVDFVRMNYGKNDFWSINGYLELQGYTPDYRGQLTWKPGNGMLNTQGFQPFPLVELDAAIQLSWSDGMLWQLMDLSPDEAKDYAPLLQNEVG
jgi:hypothetical protein